VLFVLNTRPRFVHHFIGTDNFITDQVQELAEK
jgi:hypothetical protein